ncbi:hypothetical protein APHAL10511_008115 [Amanita phalloides]|nr:hypothetical protein APHAL10511_008115 [Amanita phalloides]
MDPQQNTNNPIDTNEEREPRRPEQQDSNTPSEQAALLQVPPIQEETRPPLPPPKPVRVSSDPFRSGSQSPVAFPSQVATNIHVKHSERPEIEGLSSRGEVPADARVSRHGTLRPPGSERVYARQRPNDPARRSTIDWVVPIEERSMYRRTVEERLLPTLENAKKQRTKYKRKAGIAKWSINITVGMQIFLASLTTGLSAIRLHEKQFGIATTILGILSTLAGTFLARVRAGQEPEESLIRAHDLSAFIRDCEAFYLDYGHETGERYNSQVEDYRRRLDELLHGSPAETSSESDTNKRTPSR